MTLCNAVSELFNYLLRQILTYDFEFNKQVFGNIKFIGT